MTKKNSKLAAKGSKAPSDSKNDSLPTFDEKALSALTSKIEKGFEKHKPQQSTPNASSNGSRKQGELSNGVKKSNANPEPKNKSPELTRGTKRDANGNAKGGSKVAAKSQGPPADQKNEKGEDERAVLLQEILALGGTEEDLDLIADAESDEEDGGKKTEALPDKSLKKELAKFVAGLGIEGNMAEEESEPEVDGDEDGDEDGWEEASDVESSVASDGPEETEPAVKVPAPPSKDTSSTKDANRLVFDARPDWHAAPLPVLPIPEMDEASRYREAIANLKDYAVSLLEADANLYASKHLSSSASHRFLSTIMSSGTLSDKVSALTLVVQESPVHTTKSFESLLALAKKRSRGQAVTALSALKDLLGNGVVLPSHRRLRAFAAQPGLIATLQEGSTTTWKIGQRLPGHITKTHLISWAYEDWLKESYFDMLKVLEGWCNDEVEYARSSAVTYVYELLKEKPEQEANLLRLLVNKLGDPDKKIASRTSYLLLQLQTSHPLMKPIIVRSIESELLLRPGQSLHAKYYAINTLNQTILSGKEGEVAKKLLNVYFDLFVALLKKPDLKAAVVGPVVNRKGQIQGGGAPMGKKAKAKAAKEEEAKSAGEEVTEKMISAVLTGVNRAFPFSKTDDLTLEKHMDTLFKITHSSNFNTSIQALMLIEQLATSKHIAVDRFYRTLYESLLDPRLVTSSKHALYLNLLFRALKSDLNVKRVKAFAKRLLQVVTLHQPPFICGVIYLLRELEATFPGLKTLLKDPEQNGDEDEEVFRDVPEDGSAPQAVVSKTQINRADAYDGRKRDPEHSNADKSCLWESIPFLVHFHPSVSLFASRLMSDEKMPPKPDLASHTLSSFLDRFVYRNAKAAAGGHKGSSIMQPLSGGNSRGILLSNRSTQNGHEPVNTEAFWRKKAEDVAADDVFFHKYFSQIGKAKQASDKKQKEKKTGREDGDESENEDEIWQALVDSRPEVEGGDSGDEDMEMLDLDDSEDASSDGAVDIEGDDEKMVDVDGEDAASWEDEEVDGEGSGEDGGEDLDELFKNELQKAQKEEAGEEKDEETSRQKRRRLKNLPTFASAEDYAEMLDNDEDEDEGL